MAYEILDVKICKLKTISPVHIGSVEQRLTPFEYIIKDGQVYHISEERLAHFLGSHNLIEPYVREIRNEGHRFRIMDFFKKNNVKLDNHDLSMLSCGRFSKILGNPSIMQDFKPFIRDGFGHIYIPGTSIKGVIRTAILYNAIKDLKEKNHLDFINQVEKRILDDIYNKKNKKKLFQWGVEEWLESFILEGKEKNPNTDWLRLFHVSDAYPESNFDTFIVPVNVLKKDGKGWQLKKESHDKQTTIWVECIPEDISFRFQLSWDKKLFNDFKTQNSRINLPKNIDELLVIINNWIIDVVKEEKRFLSNHSMAKWIENKKINFRIGFGSGMMSTTIFPLLSEELRKKIRNYAGLNRGNDEAPKSRRVWIKDGSYIPLGWAVMEVLPFDAKKGLFSRPVENAQKIESPEKQETKEIENQTEKQKEIKQPEQILIQNAILVYSPGDRSLSTTVEGKKAFVDHIEDDFVPEHLWPKLKKDKNIKASIVIEPLGNAYKIIKIEG